MFGGGGGGDDHFWGRINMELGPPTYPAPFTTQPIAPVRHYYQYYSGFTRPPQPPAPAPPSLPQPTKVGWTAAENKVFEAALVDFEEGRPDRWHRIAERISGKTPRDVAEHYGRLERDVRDIEAGVVELPKYADDSDAHILRFTGGAEHAHRQQQPILFGVSKAKTEERRKGTPWTPEEHTRFLEGLEKYGKGDWRSISRNSVMTRTPTQVASHAQKYFLRQSSAGKRERRRSSIHDVVKP